MSVFHAYEKVERLEKEECDGILSGPCYIFEKIDGANAQIYLDTEIKEIAFASRNREGIVIKNYRFVNKWGRQPYGKLLHETFQEVKTKPKAPVSPDAIELAIQVQYVTEARVEKICNKVKMNVAIDKAHPLALVLGQHNSAVSNVRLEMKHIPQVINMVWYDIITEDMNDILKRLKDPTINFKLLKRLVFDRAKEYFIKSLQEGVTA